MSNKEKVEVIIDSNEATQKPELVEKLALHEDVEDYEIRPDIEGDIAIENCLFERKTPSDFASSLEEGRLRDQVERMCGTEKTPFILVEGNMEDFDSLEHTNIGSKSLRGMDASIEMRNGVSVKYCSSIGFVADMAVRLARKEKESLTSVQARQTDAVKDVSFLEQVFLAVDGVGVKTAEKLSANFESLSDAMQATQSDLKQVDDVGPSTSESIYSALHSDGLSDPNEENESKRVSHELAVERGSFENWEDSKYADPESNEDWIHKHCGEEVASLDYIEMRNHNTTTIAPTGTTSMLGNTTGGCEPIYNVAYYKNVTDDVQGDEMLVEFDSLFLETLRENDIDVDQVKEYTEELMENNEFDGVDDLVPEIPQEIADLFVTTSDLDSKEHASVLCALQEGVDSSISKTLNAPHDATVEDAKETFEYVYENGGKSVTFYRDGTRTKQVKTTRKDNQEVDENEEDDERENGVAEEFATVEPRDRPKETTGKTYKVDSPQGTLYVTINEDKYGPVEIFASVGKSGSSMESFTEAVARQVSLSLRAGVHIDDVIEQLENIRASDIAWDDGESIYSVPDAIATAMKRYRSEEETEETTNMNHNTVVPENLEETSGKECPECGGELMMKEGCESCSCGFSKCG